ncbi:hypothetical protein [Rickettsia endosymbiont of Oedothorax gibbosus]|uniref:hypothetical protein n=1 Tax=Rickettsia endosymbiont of Oedothorax gibbosus TaxID=931099 RepID=UPI00202416A1|nr:hypothetical protein [Rickettsia endosymbiont of Oedothorax gibbosus]
MLIIAIGITQSLRGDTLVALKQFMRISIDTSRLYGLLCRAISALLAMTSCTFLQILNYPDNNLVKLLSAIKNYDTITILLKNIKENIFIL